MNRVTAALIITSLGLGAASAYFHSQLTAERSRSASLETRIAEFEHSRITAVTRESHESNDTPAAASPAVTSATVATAVQNGGALPAATPSPEKGRQVRDRFMRRQQALLKDPEYREAMRMQHRMSLSQAYPDLARELGLPQEQVNRLLDLLTDQQLRSMEESRPVEASAQSDPVAIAEMQREGAERQRAQQAEIAQVLGPDGVERWQEYQNSMGSRYRVRQLTSALDAEGIPLREDQQQALRRVLAEHELQIRKEMETTGSPLSKRSSMTSEAWLDLRQEQLERQAQIYERARNAASGVLSPEQLSIYQQLQEQELAMQRAQLRIERAQRGDSAGIEIAGSTMLMPATAAEHGVAVDAAGH